MHCAINLICIYRRFQYKDYFSSFQYRCTDSQNLSDNSADFIDKSEPSIDTKLVNHLNPSNSTYLNEVNNEVFDLQTYKKFLSFLKFQEMTEKYDNYDK